MSQAQLQIPTTGTISGYTVVADTNGAILALATANSGASAPTATALNVSSLAGVLWHDTGTNTLWLRDQADANWIKLGSVDETNKLFTPNRALVPANNLSDLASISTALTNLGIGSAGLLAADTDGVLAANSDSRVPTQAAVKTYVAANASSAAIQGSFKALKISLNSSTVSITADELVVESATHTYVTLRGLSLTSLSLDTGSVTASTWYNIWIEWNGTTAKALASLTTNGTPTLTSGYTHYARVGAGKTNSGATGWFHTLQVGRRAQWVVDGSTVTGLPILASGTAGSQTTPTWVALALSGVMPPTACIGRFLVKSCSAYVVVMLAPNNSYGAYTSATNPPPSISGYGGGADVEGFTVDLILESSNVYWASSDSYGLVAVLGWEDNI